MSKEIIAHFLNPIFLTTKITKCFIVIIPLQKEHMGTLNTSCDSVRLNNYCLRVTS